MMRVIDLFAGAGGLSEGFRQAGFSIHACVEIDAWACDTLRLNFPEAHVLEADITELSDDKIADIFAVPIGVVVGGPPCQGFSVCGPAQKDPRDPRNSLFEEFIRVLSIGQPPTFVIENVPALLTRRTAAGESVIRVIQRELENLDYHVTYKTLRACDYGVPQIRERLFIVGAKFPVDGNIFPEATHLNGQSDRSNSQEPLPILEGLRSFVTLWDAISDLPRVGPSEGTEPADYVCSPQNEYQSMMRANSPGICNHVAMHHTRRMVERFKKTGYWNGHHDIPEELAPRARGNPGIRSPKHYSQNNRRMRPDRPCHTIPASFYANFLHPFLHRNFTPREGARIQSFPDRFVFKGKPTVVSDKLLAREGRHSERHLCQYNQIGNAVPPLLAGAIAEKIIVALQRQGRLDYVQTWAKHPTEAAAQD